MIRGNITTWLGREGHPVLAHLHHPAADLTGTGATTGLDAELVADVAGAIVLCPPLGREQVASYRTMRQLGDALAARGWLVVRLNWSGQSDSSPMDEELSLLDNWRADLTTVVEQVREAGVPQVHLAGLRLGALLAAGWAAELDPASLLLWDAVPSGRQFLRYEQAMYASDELPSPDDGDFHGLGYSLRAGDADQLRRLKLKDAVLPDCPTGRIVRSAEHGSFPGTVERAEGGEPQYTWTSDRMPEMLETASMTAEVPTATVSSIVQFYSSLQHGHAEPQHLELALRDAAEMDQDVDGRTVRVRETVVQLPTGLPGILTEPVEGHADQSVLYVAASSEPLDGPSGLWATSAREVAARGAMALRVDKHGTGELGGELPTDPLPYMPGFTRDVATAATWLTERSGIRPIGVGLCSGTYFQMVRPNGRLFSKVVGINLLAFDRDPADIPDEVAMATDPSHLAGEGGAPAGASLKQRLRSGLKEQMPQPMWRTLGLLGVAHAPDHFLREAAKDTELVLAFSHADYDSLARQRGEAAIAWARAHGAPMEVFVDDELDHALFGVLGRRRSLQIIRDEVQRSRRLALLQRKAG